MRLPILLGGAAACLLAQSAMAMGIDQFRVFLQATQQARGTFTQTVTASSGRKPQHSTGTFAFSRPGKFRWSYEKPYSQLLVSDGKKLWSFDPDLNQVTTRKLGAALGSSPAALLAGNSLEDNFTLIDAGSAEGIEYVEAVPTVKDSGFERVRIGFRENLPRVMEVRDNFGQTTVVELNQIERGVALPADTFRFVPPKGADVISE